MTYIDCHINMLLAKKRIFAAIDGKLFVRKSYWITPIGPAAQNYRLDRVQCKSLLARLGGLWIQYTDGFGAHAADSEWYAVICRHHTPVDEIKSSKLRSEIRRGLKNCEVRKVDPDEIAAHGYETYCAAIQGYRGSNERIPARSVFEERVRSDAPFTDIRHQWAVYHEDQMIAFAQNIIYEKTEADYTLIKLHPAYLKYYPAYALIYKMNEYYLAQQGFQYVNDGFRSILHETGIQDFLIKKFGFEKAPTGLHVYYRPPFGQLLRMARPVRGLIGRLYPQANALFELNRLSRQTR